MAKSSLVIVEWDDCMARSSWNDREEIEVLTSLRCISVGWQLKSDRKHLRLAASRCDNSDQFADITIIPRGCIVSHKRLTQLGR